MNNIQQITFDEQNLEQVFVSHRYPSQLNLYKRCIDFVKKQGVYDNGLFASFILFNTSGIARNSLTDFRRIEKINEEMGEALMFDSRTVPEDLNQLVQCLNIMTELCN